MKKTFKFFLVLLALFSVFTICVSAVEYPKPTNFYCNDFASVINLEDANEIDKRSEKLYYACKAQVVVVTVDTLEGLDIADYSIGLAREWAIGDKELDNGILLLLSVGEREVRIEVGSGLEGALPDSKTGRILDTYGIEYFRNNDFSTGLAEVQKSIVNEIYIEYGLDPEADYQPVSEEGSLAEGIITVVLVIIFIIIFLTRPPFLRRRIFFGGYHSGGFSGHSGGGFSGGGFRGGGGGFSGGGSSRGF